MDPDQTASLGFTLFAVEFSKLQKQMTLAVQSAKILTLYLLVSSADNLCEQFGPISGLTICRA